MSERTPSLDEACRRMIEKDLRGRGIKDTTVMAAMSRVPRELFVLPRARDAAYADQALPIECGQTISQPYIVALMTEALELAGGERVLELGTGSGYQTALLAELAGEVFTVERHEALSRNAEQILTGLGYANIRFRIGDGNLGWTEFAPFDRVIITAATDRCPPAVWQQLAEGGIAVGPFGGDTDQLLEAIRKVQGDPCPTSLTPCRFVPLLPGVASQE